MLTSTSRVVGWQLVMMAALSFTAQPATAQATKSSGAASAPIVRTADGSVRGLVLQSGVHAFRGIPFAAPPVRELRWRPPQPTAKWQGVRAADRFADQCMQARIYADMMFRNAGTSEDCLYLNVWSPADARATSGLPVLVYFYGGGFTAGDGSEFRYDGESLAARGIVVVTLSYRLGIFGFFSHPELTAESPSHASGNYGLMDQTAALRWVRSNIGAFGGDPKRVTIGGESAGSMSVSAQIASPLAHGLVARAIGESGSVLSMGPTATRAQTEQNGVRFAEAVGVSSLSALRALSATELLEMSARRGMPRFGVNVDGYFFPKSPSEIYASGEQAHVPLLAGWNSEESSWRSLTSQPPTPDSARAALERVFSERANEAEQYYPVGTPEEATQSLIALASDRFIAYSTWKWLDVHAATSGEPVYRYFFARPRPGAQGAVHSAEIEYALGNLGTNKVYEWSPDDAKVSATMETYFENFIKTGNPNGSGQPTWPVGVPSANGEVQRLRIDVSPRAEAEPRARYRFLEQTVARPHS